MRAGRRAEFQNLVWRGLCVGCMGSREKSGAKQRAEELGPTTVESDRAAYIRLLVA